MEGDSSIGRVRELIGDAEVTGHQDESLHCTDHSLKHH